MSDKYRKIICPNGHVSIPIEESAPLPRRCHICRQMYLRSSKPIWCDINGNVLQDDMSLSKKEDIRNVESKEEFQRGNQTHQVIFEEKEFSSNISVKRRKKRSFDVTGNREIISKKNIENNPDKEDVLSVIYILENGRCSLELKNEGTLGRESDDCECLAVDQLISREHCYYIATQYKGLLVRDAGSLNGTFADIGYGRIVVGQKENISLKPGDKLWLADMYFEVKIKGKDV